MKLECPLIKSCGNCTQGHIEHEEQVMKKAEWVSRLLGRKIDRAIISPKAHHYRSRITMRPNKEGELGYFQPRSHHHVPISKCVIAHETINEALRRLGPLPFPAKSVELRTNGSEIVLNITPIKGRKPKSKLVENWAKQSVDSVAINGQTVFGDSSLCFDYNKFKHRLGASTFFQVNQEINNLILEELKGQILEWNPVKMLDLFAGAGNLSLPIAAEGISATLIESDPSAVKDAKSTIKSYGLPASIVKQNAYSLQAGVHFYDVLLLDPPRAGAKDSLSSALTTRPKGVAYLSCNPTTLGKDLKQATKAGYRVSKSQIYDMFPHTSHVETLVFMERD